MSNLINTISRFFQMKLLSIKRVGNLFLEFYKKMCYIHQLYHKKKHY